MSKTLSYVDAVRLLGGDDQQLLARLEGLAGGALLAAVPAAPVVFALIDAKREVARFGHDLVRRLRERRQGLGRYDRTQRLAAAHTVLVISAYFESLDELDLEIPFSDLGLTKFEEVALAGQVTMPNTDSFLREVLAAGTTIPSPHGGHELYARDLAAYYERVSEHIVRLVMSLAAWDNVDESTGRRYVTAVRQLSGDAVRRYGEHLRALAADFAEVNVWLNMLEHEATRDVVHALEPALARLERELSQLTSGVLPDVLASSVARANRAALARPIAESGDVPANLAVPSLGEAYLAPLYRITVDPLGGANNEQWWRTLPIHDDLAEFLVHFLTSDHATRAPMLVLGQPGAGKSVLTRVMAARLPSEDFLVVRVPLRDVAAELDVQGQIERAIVQMTGERILWPALVRANPKALPVVLIDGFDELLQATGVRHTDYLSKVAEFQRRESDQGRPIAIMVTTRTSVADRALTPPDTLLLRLEPFDPPRIRRWVDIWNATNAGNFERANIRPLDPDTVLDHLQLAGQPLLLLMLSLYDADHNALRRLSSRLRTTELYEQLLTSFAQREIVKHRPDLPAAELAAAVEDELRRLSIVAFAMFNRGSQWVTETDLERDLDAIFGTPRPASTSEMRTPARSGELMLGRFFFVHRAQAQRDETALHTYEFLHATFGEYLVARLTWQVAMDTMARRRASTLPSGGIDDELMHALLSFAPLTARRPIVDFLQAMAADLTATPREHLGRLLIEVFRTTGLPRGSRAFDGYLPRPMTVSARHAHYTANVFLILVAVRGTILASEIYVSDSAVLGHLMPDLGGRGAALNGWRETAALWQAQLFDEFYSIVATFALQREWTGQYRDVRLTIDDATTEPEPVDPLWTYAIGSARGSLIFDHVDGLPLRRRTNFLCRTHTDSFLHSLQPLFGPLGGDALSCFYTIFPDDPDVALSAARALIDVWLLATDEDADLLQRQTTYGRCAQICTGQDRSSATGSAQTQRLATALLSALAADHRATAHTAATVIAQLSQDLSWVTRSLATQFAMCIVAFLERADTLQTHEQWLATFLTTLDVNLVDAGVRRRLARCAQRLGFTLAWPA